MFQKFGSIPLSGALFLSLVSNSLCRADHWMFVVPPYGLLPSITGDAAVWRIDKAEVELDPGVHTQWSRCGTNWLRSLALIPPFRRSDGALF